MNNTLTAVSLFTGAGGMDIGFERAGVKIIFANEMMSEAAQTYNATATLEYIDQRMAELQEKLVMCVNKSRV